MFWIIRMLSSWIFARHLMSSNPTTFQVFWCICIETGFFKKLYACLIFISWNEKSCFSGFQMWWWTKLFPSRSWAMTMAGIGWEAASQASTSGLQDLHMIKLGEYTVWDVCWIKLKKKLGLLKMSASTVEKLTLRTVQVALSVKNFPQPCDRRHGQPAIFNLVKGQDGQA